MPTVVHVIGAVTVGYYIFNTYNLLDVAAMFLFIGFVVAISFMPYMKNFMQIFQKDVKTSKDLLAKWWLSLLIYIGLAIRVMVTYFDYFFLP